MWRSGPTSTTGNVSALPGGCPRPIPRLIMSASARHEAGERLVWSRPFLTRRTTMKQELGTALGLSIGTQVFDAAGNVARVTVVEAGPCVVVRKRTEEKDGYHALQLQYEHEQAGDPQQPARRLPARVPWSWLSDWLASGARRAGPIVGRVASACEPGTQSHGARGSHSHRSRWHRDPQPSARLFFENGLGISGNTLSKHWFANQREIAVAGHVLWFAGV